MTFFTRIWRRLSGAFVDELPLIGLFVLSVAVQPLVPVGSLLARDDLAPWMTVILAATAAMRGRPLPLGPHPQLHPRHSFIGGTARRIGAALSPLTGFAWYDAALSGDPLKAIAAVGLTVLLLAAIGVSTEEGRTAWNPPTRVAAWVSWGLRIFGMATFWAVSGEVSRYINHELGIAMLLGGSFLATGLVGAHLRNSAQRALAGTRDGQVASSAAFPLGLALLGPSVGWFALMMIFQALAKFGVAEPAFGQAFIGAAHILAWAAVIWPNPVPLARACLLWEVEPTGGDEKVPGKSALGAEAAPEGALRFNPLRTRRVRVVHSWLVPVSQSRIGDLDDPVRLLWPRNPPPVSQHLLGDCAFEPDALTLKDQWDTATIRMRGRQDVATLGESDTQTRRLVILRAYPRGSTERAQIATYKWEEGLPAGSIQVLDATTDTATLKAGDVIVMSSEGVARAFEFEPGAVLYDRLEVESFRPPQLEDYVKGP